MNIKSSWLSAALFGAFFAVPTADAQMRPSTTMDRVIQRREQIERAERIEAARSRMERSRAERSRAEHTRFRDCSKYSKADKARCKELRKEEKRLAKLQKRRELCARNPNPRFCRDGSVGNGTLSDIILGGDGTRRDDVRVERRPGVHLPRGGF